MTKKGILFGVGVGTGDPELATRKAWRVVGEADVVAYPAPMLSQIGRTAASHGKSWQKPSAPMPLKCRLSCR